MVYVSISNTVEL